MTVCSEGDVGNYGVSGACLPVLPDEETLDVVIDDAVAGETGSLGPVCAHFTIYDADGESIESGAFEGEATIPLPSETDHVSVAVGDSHEDTITDLHLTDCPERKGTVGQIHATFT